MMGELWWVWLIGLLISLSVGAFIWVSNLFKTVGTIKKVSQLTYDGIKEVSSTLSEEGTTGEKANQLKDKAIKGAINTTTGEVVDRAKGIGMLAFAVVGSLGFAILLIISIVMNLL